MKNAELKKELSVGALGQLRTKMWCAFFCFLFLNKKNKKTKTNTTHTFKMLSNNFIILEYDEKNSKDFERDLLYLLHL